MRIWILWIGLFFVCNLSNAQKRDWVDWVNPLMGTDSKYELSNGNTYPAVSMPWGMNAWSPQTGANGDGWMYQYQANKIRGIKQTHQPSPWINDYGQFSLMPVNKAVFTESARASWFSHKAEKASPYAYEVYLADHRVFATVSPTERAAIFTFQYQEGDSAYVVIDAFDRGSRIDIDPAARTISGYSSRNSGGVPSNFKNYFVLEFDQPFIFQRVWHDQQQPWAPLRRRRWCVRRVRRRPPWPTPLPRLPPVRRDDLVPNGRCDVGDHHHRRGRQQPAGAC